MTDFIEVQTTTETREDAQKIGHLLVSQRLAACAHVSGPISSTYWWKDELVSEEEWIVTLKTRQDLYQDVEHTIRQHHPYEEPAIIAFSITVGSSTYLDWIKRETSTQESKNIKGTA